MIRNIKFSYSLINAKFSLKYQKGFFSSKSFIKEDNKNSEENINPLYDYTKHSLLKNLFIFGYNSDNIGYILYEPINKSLIGIDFGEFEKSRKIVEKLEKELDSRLQYIFTTHSHSDHCGGNRQWKEYRQDELKIISGNTKEDIVPYSDVLMNDIQTMTIGELCICCMHTPGHIRSHVCYVVTQVNDTSTKIPFLFTGDTLFIGGCGRVFDGTHEDLYNSLKTLSYLPNDTLIFCGHEYTQKNLEFALTIDPENEFLKEKYEWVLKMRSQGEFTVGSRLVEEKLYNPFMRAGDNYYMNLTGKDTPVESFRTLRQLKDKF